MNSLPDEIWTEIILYLPVKDLLNFNITCLGSHKIVKEYKITDYKYGHKISLRKANFEELAKYNFQAYVIQDLEYDITNDEKLKYLSNIKELDISSRDITDDSIKIFTKLSKLSLADIDCVTDDSVKLLTNLVSLSLSDVNTVSDESIKVLTNLKKLSIFDTNIKGSSFSNLIKLESLKLIADDYKLTSACGPLVNLTSLKISSYESREEHIPRDIIKDLTQLEKLSLKCYCDVLPQLETLKNLHTLKLDCVHLLSNCFDQLTNLRKLKLNHCNDFYSFPFNLTKLVLGQCEKISDNSLNYLSPRPLTYYNEKLKSINEIKNLTNLKSLKIDENIENLNDTISLLTNLKTLSLYRLNNVTDQTVKNLTNLRKLTLLYHHQITNQSIKLLTNLIEFNLKVSNIVLDETIQLFNNWNDFLSHRIPVIEKLPNIQRFKFFNHFDINKAVITCYRNGKWFESDYLINYIDQPIRMETIKWSYAGPFW